jgi:hypothetical protein
MTAIAQMPIGRIIALSKSKKRATNDLSESIEDKFSKIIDTITYRLAVRGVEMTYQGIAADLFNLRFDVLELLSVEQLPTPQIEEVVMDTNGLKGLLSTILPIYLDIMQTVLASSVLKQNKIERISLHGFHSATSFLSDEQSKLANSFLDDSLRVEFALIAVDCFLECQEKLPPSVSNDLYQFLKLAFERYAARAAFLRIWNSDNFTDHSQLIRNIHIVQSVMENEAGLFALKSRNIEDIKTHFEHTN